VNLALPCGGGALISRYCERWAYDIWHLCSARPLCDSCTRGA
jgi:hypothetical protein